MLRLKTVLKQELKMVSKIKTITLDSDMLVILQDESAYQSIPLLKTMTIQHRPLNRISELAKNLFVFASTTQLSQVEDLIRRANDRHHLRTLFIRQDINCNWLPQMLYQSNVRALKSMIVYSDFNIPQRILKAWQLGAQNQLIADAIYLDNELRVFTCALEKIEVQFKEITAMNKIPMNERDSFEIADDGSYIHWPKSDVHIDLDSIRYAIDDAWRERSEATRLMHDKRYGEAIGLLRKEHKLRQSDMIGLSERQIRRIEAGERTSFDTFKLLANAHGMNLNDYLDKIALLLRNKASGDGS